MRYDRYSYHSHAGYHRALSAPSHGTLISRRSLDHEHLLLAVACTLVSAKYTEPDENLPKLSTLQRLVGHAVSWDRVVRAEEEILIMLDWQMELQMPHNYL